MPRPQTAETELRAAFERLKNDSPVELPKGSHVSLTNVAAEAKKSPSSLRKDRYPALYKEIAAYGERQFVAPKKTKRKKTKISSSMLVQRLRRDKSKLSSIVNTLIAINEELMRENEFLRQRKI